MFSNDTHQNPPRIVRKDLFTKVYRVLFFVQKGLESARKRSKKHFVVLCRFQFVQLEVWLTKGADDKNWT